MANAGTIDVSLKLDGASKFSKDIEKATAKLGGFGDIATKAASAFAGFQTVTKAFNIASTAQQINTASRAFQAAGGNLDSVRAATQGLISDADLVRKANLANTLGITGKAFDNLAQISLAAAAKTGQSVDFLFDSIITGTARQSKQILDNLGILVSVGKANEDYAKTLGKTSQSLTDAEKKQAFLNSVQSQGSRIIDELNQAGISIANPFAQFTAAAQNAGQVLGNVLIPVFQELFTFIRPVVDRVNAFSDTWARLNPRVKEAIGIFGAISVAIVGVVTAVAGLSTAFSALSAVFGLVKARLALLPPRS